MSLHWQVIWHGVMSVDGLTWISASLFSLYFQVYIVPVYIHTHTHGLRSLRLSCLDLSVAKSTLILILKVSWKWQKLHQTLFCIFDFFLDLALFMLLSFSVCTMLPSHLCSCLFRCFTRAETLGLTRKSKSISLESPGQSTAPLISF